MPLIKHGNFIVDEWQRPAENGSLPSPGKLLLPLERLAAEGEDLLADGYTIGMEIANNAALANVEPWLGRVALITIDFPKHADGRGFTLAQRLHRLDYKGELRAVGHIIPDQYALALSCGFDTVEISAALAERQPEAHWKAAERAMTLTYQRNAGAQRSILQARWAS